MIINKFILHVLDKNSDIAVLNGEENELSNEVEKFYEKIIRKILRDDDLRKASYEDYETNPIRVCADHIIYDENSFVMSSQGIASLLFDSMKINSDLESCDLAVVLYTHKEDKGVAVIKLDYKKLYTHQINYDESSSKITVKMLSNEVGIQASQKIVHAALLGPSSINDEWHLRVLDKKAEKQETDSSFVTDFLKVKKVSDEKYLTKSFRTDTDNWITNAFANDIGTAENIRHIMNYSLKEQDEINVEEFIEASIEDEDKKESYKEMLEDRGIQESFPIDKEWVDKKLKRRRIKTDTGFEIKGLLEDFEDPMKYSIRKNEDGSVDLIVKNIDFFEEK